MVSSVLVDIISLFVSGLLLYWVLTTIVLGYILSTLSRFILNKYTLTIIFSGIILYIFFPNIVSPYYNLLLTYFMNGLGSVILLIKGFIQNIVNLVISN